ncbi:hypothetical protein FHR90_001175 [Endobacter medicaginis]|uniref:ATP-binding protein n=1 Tax=Endobacter medicaginis TaxID=1181271 RepID=A0A839V171_9PROT|nr:ATP-binding protein [Endobacter medicaginis]MBB3173352.1 hypothetical protein [Endobacter medicaginis]MCX5476831.1 ATP-binding protein [Endobacter medicaginis]NVN30958.1 ATP-binding protein [Endobacter medicaginis]
MEHDLLARIADALDRLAPKPPLPPAPDGADAFVWQPGPPAQLAPVSRVAGVSLGLLQGVERQARVLLDNTQRFADGHTANNAMLWGARGTGKSSLAKAVHAEINAARPGALALIEIQRDDLTTLPALLEILRASPRRCVVFCDDLSFEREDADYKALKSVLDGGIRGRPENVLFYATSNRRHLMPRAMIDNESATAINPGEAVEEKVSLSDRFGLWLGFHNVDQATYLAMIEGYVRDAGLSPDPERLRAEALAWAMERGGRSGRVAWQFFVDYAARNAE